MGFDQIQEEMAKRTFAPVVGFVKLRLGVPRPKDMVMEIAMRWTKFLRTGGLGVRFMAMDRSTVMFNMLNGKEVRSNKKVLREFLLSQEEAYEVKIGKQEFRRPADPPLDDVVDKLQAKQSKDDEDNSENEVTKDEL